MNNFYIMVGLEVIIVLLLGVLAVFVGKFPVFAKLIFAKRVVWEIDGDGQMTPVKARTHSGAMITKSGIYPYNKEDIVRCSGLTGILVHKASDSRAINPRIAPVLSLFKSKNIDSMEHIEAILKAPLISNEKYEQMLKENEVTA